MSDFDLDLIDSLEYDPSYDLSQPSRATSSSNKRNSATSSQPPSNQRNSNFVLPNDLSFLDLPPDRNNDWDDLSQFSFDNDDFLDIPASSSKQSTNDGRLSYEDFFNKVQMYLNNDNTVKFTSAADKKMLYTTLQTLERISTDNGVLLQAYKNNAKIKVANSIKLEENKYKLGVQKRHKTRIFSLSNRELFDHIYETTEREVFPVYLLLWNAKLNKTPYGRNTAFINAVRQGGDEFKVLENKTDKYLYGIYDEYESRSIEIHDMIQNGKFQMFEGEPYIYENQKLRLSQFTPKTNNSAPKSPKQIKPEGHRYQEKIHAVFENMKSFVLGGDDDIWREWYISHGKKEKYDDLKNKWNSFVKENKIYIQIENNAIYLSVNLNGSVEPTKIPFTTLENFANNRDYDDDELRDEDDIRLIQTVQKMLRSIYDDDLNMFKSHLFKKNHGNKHLTSYLSRYEIMKSDNNTIEDDLNNTLDKDLIPGVLKKIDFMLFPKKSKRSRSLRIIPKNKTVVATPTMSPIETPPPFEEMRPLNDGINKRRKSPKKK